MRDDVVEGWLKFEGVVLVKRRRRGIKNVISFEWKAERSEMMETSEQWTTLGAFHEIVASSFMN